MIHSQPKDYRLSMQSRYNSHSTSQPGGGLLRKSREKCPISVSNITSLRMLIRFWLACSTCKKSSDTHLFALVRCSFAALDNSKQSRDGSLSYKSIIHVMNNFNAF